MDRRTTRDILTELENFLDVYKTSFDKRTKIYKDVDQVMSQKKPTKKSLLDNLEKIKKYLKTDKAKELRLKNKLKKEKQAEKRREKREREKREQKYIHNIEMSALIDARRMPQYDVNENNKLDDESEKLIKEYKSQLNEQKINDPINKQLFLRGIKLNIINNEKTIKKEKYKNVLKYILETKFYKLGITKSIVEYNIISSLSKNRKDIKMRGTTLGYKFLNDIKNIKFKEDENKCAFDYILDTLQGKENFKKFNIVTLKKQLKELNINYTEGLTVEEIKKWIITYYPKYINMYPIDPLMQVFDEYTHEEAEHSLCFILNNNHCYGISDSNLKKSVAIKKQLSISKIHFKTETNNSIYINDVNDEKLLLGDYDVDTIFYSGDMQELCLKIAEKTKYLITNIDIRKSKVEAFVHPLKNIIIKHIENYDDINESINILNNAYNKNYFDINKYNTYTTIGKLLFRLECGDIPEKSFATVETNDIIDKYHTKPLIQTFNIDNVDEIYKKYSFDINKSYSNAILSMSEDIPVFTRFDEFKPYDGILEIGEYLLKPFCIKKLGGISFDRMILTHNIVSYLLKNKYITSEKILYKRRACHYIKKEVFKKFVNKVYDLFPVHKYKDIGKNIVNSFIGNLGKRYFTEDKGAITNSLDTINALITDYKNCYASYTQINNLYFFRLTTKERIQTGDNDNIYRFILCQGIINLLEMIKTFYKENDILVGYNVDSCFILSKDDEKIIPEKSIYKNEEWKPKIYTPIKYREKYNNIYNNKSFNILNENEHISQKSYLMQGIGGSGKSFFIKQNYNEKRDLVFAFTNCACQNLREKNINVMTLDSYFNESRKINFKKIEKIIIDEISMVPIKFINILYNLKIKYPSLTFQFYGDFNQLPPVQPNLKYYEYKKYNAFKFLCDYNIVYKSYIEKTARYDNQLKEVLDIFINTKKLPNVFKPIETIQKIKTNICYLNETKHRGNQLYIDKFGIKEGMKVFCITNNFKKYNIFNNKLLIINEIIKRDNETFYTLKDLDGNILEAEPINSKYFEMAYCQTTHKYQGLTINENYNIHDVDKMSFNCLYTALSRAKKLSQIHLNYTEDLKNKIFEEEKEDDNIYYNIDLIKIEETNIYRIIDENNVYFFNNTTDNLVNENIKKQFSKNSKIEYLKTILFKGIETIQGTLNSFINNFKDNKIKILNEINKEENEKIKISMGANLIKENNLLNIIDDGKMLKIQYKGNYLYRTRYNEKNKEEKMEIMQEKKKTFFDKLLFDL